MSCFRLFCTMALTLIAPICSLAAENAKPNIILIMADDFGYECVTANGGESYETPNLDKLAATGVRFEHCYVQPVCTPTRVQLMTGLSNVRNYFVFGRIDSHAVTFAHLLKKAGYATGIAGKWQLGKAKDFPQQLGFDEALLWQHTRRPPRYVNPGLELNGKEQDYNNGEYGPDLINDFAIDFVTRHKDEPFLLYYPMLLTHGPYLPTPDSAGWDPQAHGEETGKDPKHFADMVAYMDKLVGRLMGTLDELELRENTLVIFLGDNGTGPGTMSRFKGEPYPGGKGQTTARGMRVPLIVNWPAQMKAPAVNADLISSTDFLPTLCEAAGAEIPKETTADGQSFLPQIVGEQGSPRETLYTWYGTGEALENVREFAMTKEYKLYRDGRFFDLTADPFEQHALDRKTLTGAQAEAAEKLAGVLDKYQDARPAAVDEAAKAATDERPGRANRKQRQGRRRQRGEATLGASVPATDAPRKDWAGFAGSAES